MSGDHLLEDLRTHGRDPRHRRSLYASAFTHLLIIIVIPYLLSLGGCVEPYRVPKGSGNRWSPWSRWSNPRRKRKNPHAAPELRHPFRNTRPRSTPSRSNAGEADPGDLRRRRATPRAGKIGKGGGSKGGWPEGMDDYKIRFIRLEHGGAAGTTAWTNPEPTSISSALRPGHRLQEDRRQRRKPFHRDAAKYPEDGFPPFVFLTGNGAWATWAPTTSASCAITASTAACSSATPAAREFHQSFMRFMAPGFPGQAAASTSPMTT
jgi:hypothetical protein